jgi:hypothetical protein
MATSVRTADKEAARLVLFALADAPQALSRDEIKEIVAVFPEVEIDKAIHDLTEARVLSQRDGLIAVSEEMPGVSLWSESYGFAGTRDISDALFRFNFAILWSRYEPPGPHGDMWANLRFRLEKPVKAQSVAGPARPHGWRPILRALVGLDRPRPSFGRAYKTVSTHMKAHLDMFGPPADWLPDVAANAEGRAE